MVAQVVIEDDVLEGVLITMSQPVLVVKESLPSRIKGLLASHPDGLSKNAISEELAVNHKSSNPVVEDLKNQGVLDHVGSGPTSRYVLKIKDAA